jgi:hypothetical protein
MRANLQARLKGARVEETAEPGTEATKSAAASATRSLGALQLSPAHLLIAILPLCIVLGGDLLLQLFVPAPPLLEVIAGDIAHAEGAARLHLMAGFLLVGGSAAAAVAFLASMVARLETRSMVMVAPGSRCHDHDRLPALRQELGI